MLCFPAAHLFAAHLRMRSWTINKTISYNNSIRTHTHSHKHAFSLSNAFFTTAVGCSRVYQPCLAFIGVCAASGLRTARCSWLWRFPLMTLFTLWSYLSAWRQCEVLSLLVGGFVELRLFEFWCLRFRSGYLRLTTCADDVKDYMYLYVCMYVFVYYINIVCVMFESFSICCD